MKKLICFIGVWMLALWLLAGCGRAQTPSEQGDGAGKLKIVCTTFPQYDWILNLLGEAGEYFDVTLLVQNSADIHNYQPSARDMIDMKEADLFVYVGGESDGWVLDMMHADPDLAAHSVSLMDVLGDQVLTGEILQELGHIHEHAGDDDHDNDHEHADTLADEHVWLSLEKAELLCRYLSDRLTGIAPEHEKEISANTTGYINQLHELGTAYGVTVEESAGNPLIFGDRFPFCYLAADYDLEYYAAYTGCNAEVEVGFETIIALADKIDTLKVPYVLVIDGSDRSLAETIVSTAKMQGVEILELNSMQSISMDDIRAGATYLGIMQENLEVLRKALGES